MRNFLILRFMDLFKSLFLKTGYDYNEIRLILQLKLTDSSRRSPLKFSQIRKKKLFKKLNIDFSFLIFMFLGILFATMAVSLAIISPFISFTFLFSIVGFFIMLTIFNEFTTVFFDLKDSELILPTPIKPESLSIGKNLFLLIIFLKYSIALSLPSIIFYGYYFNIFITFPILVMLIFEMLLLISFTAILFGILLKYFSGERLKDFTNYLQIVVSLIMFIGYQLIVRNVDKLVIFFENGISNWFLLFPPAWFAALPSLFFPEIDAPIMIMLSVIAIIVSISSYMLFVKLIAPFFENNLFKMNINKTIPKKKKSFILFSKFFSKFNFGIFYNFANKMLSSDRKLKMTIYPTLAIALFFPIMFFYQSLKENGENLKNTPLYFMLYLLSMFTIQIYVIVYHSQHYQASWLFRYLPIKSPKPIFQGTLLAIFFKFQFPLLVLSSLFVLKFWGIKLLPEIFVIILNSIIIVFLFNIMGERILPFSRKFVGNRALSYRGTSYLLVSVVFFPIVGGIHYAFTLFSGGIFILILIQIFAIVMLWRGFFNSLNWLEIKE